MLSAAQNRSWRALITAVTVLEGQLDRQSRRDGGLPHAHYTLLVLLYENGEKRLRMSQLASALQSSPSRITHAAASLERAGLVTRAASEEDRRVQYLELTPAGVDVIRRVTPGQVAEIRARVFGALSPDEAVALERIATAIVTALDDARR